MLNVCCPSQAADHQSPGSAASNCEPRAPITPPRRKRAASDAGSSAGRNGDPGDLEEQADDAQKTLHEEDHPDDAPQGAQEEMEEMRPGQYLPETDCGTPEAGEVKAELQEEDAPGHDLQAPTEEMEELSPGQYLPESGDGTPEAGEAKAELQEDAPPGHDLQAATQEMEELRPAEDLRETDDGSPEGGDAKADLQEEAPPPCDEFPAATEDPYLYEEIVPGDELPEASHDITEPGRSEVELDPAADQPRPKQRPTPRPTPQLNLTQLDTAAAEAASAASATAATEHQEDEQLPPWIFTDTTYSGSNGRVWVLCTDDKWRDPTTNRVSKSFNNARGCEK